MLNLTDRTRLNPDSYLYNVCSRLTPRRVKNSGGIVTRYMSMLWIPSSNTSLILATYKHIKLCRDSDGDYYLHAEVN